ncbi:MAG: holo-ACP synthase [Oscillospiraceae bacterium]
MVKCGTDIIEIDRIYKACRNVKFLTKNFTENELKLFDSKKANKYQTIAGNFAVKEALAKAIGTGFNGFNLIDIEVLRDIRGKPFLNVSSKIKNKIDKYFLDISISNNKKDAIAFVVMIKK